MNSSAQISSSIARGVPLTSWTETTVGAATTPAISVSGTARASVITLMIDAAADWSGNLGDYSLANASVINLGTSNGLTGQTYTFSGDLGTIAGGRFITTAAQTFNNSPVSAGPGQTIRITGDLTRSGYEVKSITVDHTY
mgnify:FL=1